MISNSAEVRGLLLDVGSARGTASAEICGLFSSCFALDIDRAVLDELVSEGRSNQLIPLQADAEHLPFPDGTFDRVRLLEVLEHVEKPAVALGEAARCLRDEGHLEVTVPTAYSERVYWRLYPGYRTQSTHRQIFERLKLVEMFESAGLEVVGTSTHHFAPMIAWFVHCMLRTHADHTGKVLEHQWVDRVVSLTIGALRRTPLVGRGVRHLASRYGKSWGFDCVKVPSLR